MSCFSARWCCGQFTKNSDGILGVSLQRVDRHEDRLIRRCELFVPAADLDRFIGLLERQREQLTNGA